MRNFTISLFSLLFLLSGTLAAQSVLQKSPKAVRLAKAVTNNTLYTGTEPASAIVAPQGYTPQSVNGLEKIDQEINIGRTLYDLQSNSANCNRISMTPAGRIAATWTLGFEDTAYPDRGTGYNTRVNSAWSDSPEARLESVRTGWANHSFTASGKEIIVAHTSDNELWTLTRDNATSGWTESTIPSATPNGMLWPRAAVGGADGESIHVIAITAPIALGGVAYEGVDGHILYYRSTDGGATWDQTDIAIDGLGSDFTFGTDADSYYIDARGDAVAFAVFNSFDDVLLFKSEDNGSTWSKTIVNDFPLELYQIDAGYTYEDLPPFMDERPDSLAIYTSDGYGTVLVDDDGKAHVFFGEMFVLDENLSDGLTSYFPGTDGLAYWNEDYADAGIPATTILGVIDQNGNDTLDIQADANGLQVGLYFASLTSMPSAGIDADGNLFVTYASVVEGEVSLDDDMQHYRHVYVSASLDGGETWADPIDIIQPEIVTEPDLVDFVEAVFPTMVRDVTNHVRLIYMQDYRPGLSVRGDEDEAADNYINYVQIPVEDFGIVNNEELVEPAAFALQLAPNVTADRTMASFSIDQPGQVSLSLMNAHGQLVSQLSNRHLPAGSQQEQIDLSNFASGVYYLTLRVDNAYTVVELIKQ